MNLRTSLALLVAVALPIAGCGSDDGDSDSGGSGDTETTIVGTFDGLFDDVVTGFNFPFDIGIVPDDPETEDEIEGGDIFVADYGRSRIMHVPTDAHEPSVSEAQMVLDGSAVGLLGATAVSVPTAFHVWTTFELGGPGDNGGVAILTTEGEQVAVLDGDTDGAAFAHPGGICYGGTNEDGTIVRFFMVNLGDGTLWRIEATDFEGTDPVFTQVGSGLATGVSGNPTAAGGGGITSSKDLPEGGARGCAYHQGFVYVADAQNARVVRFEDADEGEGLSPIALEDTPSELVTYPTDVAVNDEGFLIVISYDNAHAFVSLELPGGGFYDNGLHDLNVNSGNYGIAVADETIWFTRANNSNGSLRAITPEPAIRPTTDGPFPPQ